jgi:glucose/arabinose dehydrogenase/cytochrome c551/c552
MSLKKRLTHYLLMALTAGVISSCSQKRTGEPRVLVFTKTAGFHHASIPDGVAAIQKLGQEQHFIVDTTSDAEKFTEENLVQYSAVIFMSTTGNVLDAREQADFERYIEAGGGYMGVHAAADCEYHWPWYGKLVGAYFKSHPHPQQAKLVIHPDQNFPVLDSLPNPWSRTDEWYNFRALPQDVHVLISIDESSYQGGENGADHPMVWYHGYDGGRAFYMELGHTPESYQDPNFLKLLNAGIRYAIGKNLVLDYSKATALRKPDDNRFQKKYLAGGLDEPTELTVLPNLDVLIAERKGNIKFYNAADKTITKVASLQVYDKALHTKGVNVEMGLLGIQADPKYKTNHWVYVYYSPEDKSVDRLSRFKFENNQFNLKSEQVILEVNTDREICCHTGGSIAFDNQDNLLVSVGDNTTPFDEKDSVTGKAYPLNSHGYSPVDDRPGFEHFDDRRAAGNSNDLRGKILRIHVNEDGTYSIPDGNLFPKGTAKTRPEIYVMGDRNPYRISVDKHNNYLYWGEVGPDANNDSLETHGPRGYDEINQARKAGNFGWPYFVGNNYPYHAYNYATGAPGPVFDPNHVENTSRNNTGVVNLPNAHPAFIWYPYAESPDFPILGKGGRCAMAGPVYYVDDYPEQTRYPEYYNGKLFIYDWIRNWIMAVTMDKEGNLQTIEPFMQDTKFHNISDMEAGPDGRIYIVEYGEGWFSRNADAALSVITYNSGNRAPEAQLSVKPVSGSLPLQVTVSAAGSQDPDGDALSYTWHFGTTDQKTDSSSATHTFDKPGVYPVSVTVSDGKGGEAKSQTIPVYAGNSRPSVEVRIAGNQTFYFPGHPVAYEVHVTDAQDGSSDTPGFDPAGVFIKTNYLESPDRAALSSAGLKDMEATMTGKSLMESLDCKSCHKIDEKSIGPSFKQVALRYAKAKRAIAGLPDKIIRGGSGNWGETAMAAHPDLSEKDATQIVSWILSLADTAQKHSMPMKGSFNPSREFQLTPSGAVVLTASYTDKGAGNVPALTGISEALLRSPFLAATDGKTSAGVSSRKLNGAQVKVITADSGWIAFPAISLQDIHAAEIQFMPDTSSAQGWHVAARLDGADGTLIGEAVIGKGRASGTPEKAALTLSPGTDGAAHKLYFVFSREQTAEKNNLSVMGFLMKE